MLDMLDKMKNTHTTNLKKSNFRQKKKKEVPGPVPCNLHTLGSSS